MNKKILVICILAATTLLLASQVMAQTGTNPNPDLGEFLYFDENLSDSEGQATDGQACASCHHPNFGFVDPDADLPVSEGVVPGRFGGRNSPSAAYAMYAPIRYFDLDEKLYIGGQFWDSRATGGELGDPLADQALGPFLNTVEMNMPSEEAVVQAALDSVYGDLFEASCVTTDPIDFLAAYDCIALSIGLFERTELFAPFNSQYDAYLQACLAAGGDMEECAKGIGKVASKVGKKYFSKEEWNGFQLFMNENNNNDGIPDPGEGAMCVACHVADWTPDPGNVVVPAWAPENEFGDKMIPPMFTDFTYDNLGVPQNTEYPLDPNADPDLGLGPIVGDEAENGKFKVMTLRNIGLTAPYAHNGLFKSLKEITHFYNTRDLLPVCTDAKNQKPMKHCWPGLAEVPETVNFDELGNLGLTDADEDAIVEFMKTLSDGYAP